MNLPHITFYTDNLPANVGGRATGPIVRIKPQYRDDKGIHAHEMVHVAQWYAGVAIGAALAALVYFVPELASWKAGWPLLLIMGAMLHPLATTIPAYCLWKEVQAYKEQAKWYANDRRLLFASYIACNYGLDITTEDAYKLLMKD